MATEAHIQGIARFIVGFGTEEDENWRDYHFDFCGTIDYDEAGAPVVVKPVENSGYSLGCLQLDFGQTTKAAEPFVEAFEVWHQANPGELPLVSKRDFVVKALTSDGRTLKAKPKTALHKQDVEALSAFVLSSSGSDWVNDNIDNALIGSDRQKRSVYSSEFTLVGIARKMEATTAFKAADKANRANMADLLYAMTMKAYNQSPGNCVNRLLPFLGKGPSDDDIVDWPEKFSGAFRDGVKAAISLAQMWSKLITATSKWTPPAWLLAAQSAVDREGLSNPRRKSAASGEYVVARQAFESPQWVPKFAQAMQAGKDYIPATLFDSKSGALKIVKKTGRVHQGVMVKKTIGYVWDTAGDAYQLKNGQWAAIPINQVTSK